MLPTLGIIAIQTVLHYLHMKNNKMLMMRVDEDSFNLISKKAKEAGLKISTFARAILLKAIKDDVTIPPSGVEVFDFIGGKIFIKHER